MATYSQQRRFFTHNFRVFEQVRNVVIFLITGFKTIKSKVKTRYKSNLIFKNSELEIFEWWVILPHVKFSTRLKIAGKL